MLWRGSKTHVDKDIGFETVGLEQILALKPAYTENPFLQTSIYVESPLVFTNVK